MAKSEKNEEKNIPSVLEMTKDITVAWLNAYKTDLSIRRQRGVVPLFTPTNAEVAEFIAETYKMVKDIADGKEIVLPSEKEKEQIQMAEANKFPKFDLPIADVKKSPVPALDLSSLPKADSSEVLKHLDLEPDVKPAKKGSKK